MRLSKKFILPKLIGHRGVKNLKPENTLESINTAFDLGLDCVEIDVKVSKDSIPLLLHDDTLDRTTNGSGLVCNFTFDQINHLDAGYYFYNSKWQFPAFYRGFGALGFYLSLRISSQGFLLYSWVAPPGSPPMNIT